MKETPMLSRLRPWPIIPIALVVLSLHTMMAQEPKTSLNTPDAEPSIDEPEAVTEINAQLVEINLHRKRLSQHLAGLNRQKELLERLRDAWARMHALQQQAEQLPEESPKRERLADQIHQAEISIEHLYAQLELAERATDLALLESEVNEIGLSNIQTRFERLRELLQLGRDLINQRFDHYRAGNELAAEEIAEELEQLSRKYDQRIEHVHLRMELHFARREGDSEAEEELRREIELLEQIESLDQKEQASPQPTGDALPTRLIEPDEQQIRSAASFSMTRDVQPLLERFCMDCHHSGEAAGDLDLQSMIRDVPLVRQRSRWKNVQQQLRIGSMPPSDHSVQPTDIQRGKLLAWLAAVIDRFDYSQVHSVGYEPARRLTHDEYNHTIRDLFGIDLRPADHFPTELAARSGFDNSATSLFIQPVTMERYLGAAERIVQSALPWPNPKTDSGTAITETETSWDRILAGGDPREALVRFVSRAFRRPVATSDLSPFLNHYDRAIDRGTDPHIALRDSIALVLVSPSFLIRTEHDQSGTSNKPFRVSDHELASRLSYFLWASMPDDLLRNAADRGQLSNSKIVTEQVNRMIADDRAMTLGRVFASQWLGFVNLNRVARDQIEHPWATDSLFDAMHEETAMVFYHLIRDNEPVERLLDADFTFVNDELARHYGIEGVSGDHLRRVSLAQTPRRGVIGHASILAITSFPGRTSPVVRGNWVLSTLLGTPPPPPPPNVSQFDERLAEHDELTAKQKLQLHPHNPNCSNCHQLIDPIGFALERFDHYGRFRLRRGGKPIDATARLPEGDQIDGLMDLETALRQRRRDDLLRQLTSKMLSYALGRPLEYYDQATVDRIIQKVNADDRRLQTLIHAIAASDTFQMKQSNPHATLTPPQDDRDGK